MDVWKKHEILIQMKHALGKVFFFFFFQSAGPLALVTLMPSAAHALAVMIPPTH